MKITAAVFSILLCAVFVNAQQFKWEWQNPKITGNNLNDIVVLAPGKLLAAGDAGVILTSDDSGENWNAAIADDLYRDIKAVDFVNQSVGWACGSGGLIIKTTDGGKSGSIQTSGTAEDLWDIDFIDADTGYAVGANGTLLKTTDGGTTWNKGVPPVSHTIYAVKAVNAANVLIGTTGSTTMPVLLKSTNYGVSFQNVTPAGYTSAVYSITNVDGNNIFAGGSSGKILRSTDGGSTYTETADLGSGANYQLLFTSVSNGYVVSGGDVYKTEDGGTIWTPVSVSRETLRGIALDGTTMYASGNFGTLAKSTNTGAGWSLIHDAVTQEQIREIHFFDPLNGVAASGSTTASDNDGFLLKTTNGGADWQKMPFNFTLQVYSMAFPAADVWFAGTGNNKLFKTTNAGADWTQLTQPITGTTHDFYAIEFADLNNGYAAGSSGKIIRTTDGGTTWTETTSPFGTSIVYDIKVFDPLTVIGVSLQAKAYKTTNGGQTWTQLNTQIPGNFFALKFLNNSYGVVAGFVSNSAPYLSITTDQGATWTPYVLSEEFSHFSSIWGIGMLDEDHIWFGDVNGNLGYTADGGATFHVANKPASGGIYSIDVSGEHMWLAGSGGAIIKGFGDPAVPVELTSFTAKSSGSSVLLRWSTATESNNRGFSVERRVNGGKWTSAAFIEGAGSSVESKNYSYTDNSAPAGTLVYRLKQIDFDGSYEYSSEVEVVTAPAKYSLSQNYPNPFNPSTVINYSTAQKGLVTLKVYNLIGQEVAVLVNSTLDAGSYSARFDASNLAGGIYFYELTSGSFKMSRKMMLVK